MLCAGPTSLVPGLTGWSCFVARERCVYEHERCVYEHERFAGSCLSVSVNAQLFIHCCQEDELFGFKGVMGLLFGFLTSNPVMCTRCILQVWLHSILDPTCALEFRHSSVSDMLLVIQTLFFIRSRFTRWISCSEVPLIMAFYWSCSWNLSALCWSL